MALLPNSIIFLILIEIRLLMGKIAVILHQLSSLSCPPQLTVTVTCNQNHSDHETMIAVIITNIYYLGHPPPPAHSLHRRNFSIPTALSLCYKLKRVTRLDREFAKSNQWFIYTSVFVQSSLLLMLVKIPECIFFVCLELHKSS